MAQLIDLKVGFSCNNHCIHCVISDKTDENDLTLDEIKKMIDKYIERYGKIQLTLTGGEVTIRKDFFELMNFIKNRKENGKITFVDVQTNGRMLSNDDRQKAAEDVIDFYLIALHCDLPKIHDSITMAKGSFIQTTNAIRKISTSVGKEKIAIQTVINRKNYQRLKNIYKFVHDEFGLTEFNITFPHPIGLCYSQKIVPTYKEVQPYVNEALSYCLENGIKPYIEELPFCVFIPSLRKYAFDFLERRCINVIGYGGQKDGEIDYQKLFSSGHKKYKSCSICKYNKKCEGVWKEYFSLYPDENMLELMH